ncbi:hypothetical protein GKZ89_13700 [Bacillus mangrovi]|uniref:Holin n=1 Tax=Metabacillus mangrovi TaxID=1491830 RepID=A0A7X2S6A3_9BACI|nr:phage holin family protein [Metabacillus mangrovi]MTH54453.1 hypothetical protein [Metabacillus mangrovi]
MGKDAEVMTLYSLGMMILTFFLGEIEQMMYVLFALMAIEFLSFTISRVIKGNAAFKDIMAQLGKLAMILIMVSLANLLDKVVPMDFSLKDMTVTFYIFYEMLHIITHVSSAGLPIPQFVKDFIEGFRNMTKK